MKIQMLIEKKITDHLLPDFLKVENESHRHAVPENSETHFKVTIVSDRFNEMRLLARHRLINQLLKIELDGPVHALALHTFTNSEWAIKEGLTRNSADCLGKGN